MLTPGSDKSARPIQAYTDKCEPKSGQKFQEERIWNVLHLIDDK